MLYERKKSPSGIEIREFFYIFLDNYSVPGNLSEDDLICHNIKNCKECTVRDNCDITFGKRLPIVNQKDILIIKQSYPEHFL